MFGDSLTTLYIVLSIAIVLLTIFLSIALIYLILILRDTSKMLEKIRDTVDKVNAFVVKPVTLAAHIVDRIRPIIEAALDRKREHAEHHGHRTRKTG